MKIQRISVIILFALTFKICYGQGTDETVKSNSHFAFELYKNVFNKDKNVFFSPYSISSALAMAYAGAKGETEKQMSDVLHFDLKQINTHRGFSELNKHINSINKDTAIKLKVANCVWIQKGLTLAKDYRKTVEKYYKTPFYSLDSAGTDGINKWVARETNDKIKHIVQEDDLNDAVLVLTNAIYFKGTWLKPFESNMTKDGIFHTFKNEKVKAKMMYKKDNILYAEDESMQIISMPYSGMEMNMVIILPQTSDNLEALSRKIDNNVLQTYFASMKPEEVKLYLPKFKIESDYELNKILSEMGMPDAFDDSQADFSGMFGLKSDDCISKVKHKAFIEVNEKTTEAAAATITSMKTTSFRPNFKEIVFRADRPFLFLIKDNKTGSILFMGSMVTMSNE